jgi:nicotinamide-nucleotide amidase
MSELIPAGNVPADSDLHRLALRVAERLAGRRLALAESCTGGWIAKLLTDIPGSSRWFERGWVTYSNAAKEQELGVPGALLAAHGAVSAEVARAMAEGALSGSGADVALAVTGIAGPDGGTPTKPVGTVWLGLATARGTQTRLLNAAGGRDDVRRASVQLALQWLIDAA